MIDFYTTHHRREAYKYSIHDNKYLNNHTIDYFIISSGLQKFSISDK